MLNILKALLTRALIAWLERKVNRLEKNVVRAKTKLEEKRLSQVDPFEDQYNG